MWHFFISNEVDGTASLKELNIQTILAWFDVGSRAFLPDPGRPALPSLGRGAGGEVGTEV